MSEEEKQEPQTQPTAETKNEEQKPAKAADASPQLIVSSTPHVRSEDTVRKIMIGVILALVPAFLNGLYVFGPRVLVLTAVCIGGAMGTEYVVERIRGRAHKLSDASAILTGLLFAFMIPPVMPYWTALIGVVAGMLFGKAIFGGLGQNFFNPALVGYAFLQATFPVIATTWAPPFFWAKDTISHLGEYMSAWFGAIPQVFSAYTPSADMISYATPLAHFKFAEAGSSYLDKLTSPVIEGQTAAGAYASMFFGSIGGTVGETSALALLLGAGYMLYKQIIDLRIPVAMLGGALGLSAFLWLYSGQTYPDPLFQLLAGGMVLGAFFMATDPVTSPVTPKGQIIFGVGAGMIAVIIRIYGGYPEGVMYALLVMNALVPLINRYTRPRIYGHEK